MSHGKWTPLDIKAHEDRLRSSEWISFMRYHFTIQEKQDMLDFIDSLDGIAYLHGITPCVEVGPGNQYSLRHPDTKQILWLSPLKRKNSPLQNPFICDSPHNSDRV